MKSNMNGGSRFGFESADDTAPAGETGGEDSVIDVAAAAGEAAEEAADAAGEAADAASDAADAAGEAAEAVAEAVEAAEDDNEALSQMDSAEAAADAADADVEELEGAAAGLESIYDYLADATQNGGLNRQAAQAVTLAAEAYAERIGLPSTGIASLESFGGDSSKVRATTMSMESIGEQLKAIWKKIWDFLVKVKDAVWNFIKRLFSASERLKKAGDDLTKLNLTGEPKNKSIKLKGYARKIAVGTRVDTNPEKGLGELTALVKTASKIDTDNEARTDKMVAVVQEVAGGKPFNAALIPAFAMPSGFSKENGLYVTPLMPGNVRFALKTREFLDGKIVVGTINKLTVAAKVSEDAEIPTLSPAAIKAAGTAASALQTVVSQAQIQAKRNSDSLKKKNVKLPENMRPNDASTAKALLGAYRFAEAAAGQMTAKVCAAAVNAAFAYVKIAQKSAAEYGGKKKKDEAAAAA